VLASASPRRRELLAGLGLAFELRPVDLDETPRPGEPPRDYVLRLAEEKAAAAAGAGELVLAADTTVVLDGEIVGKPADAADARAVLRSIAGRRHVVLTGLALEEGDGEPDRGRRATAVVESEVEMTTMSDEQIAWYVATGEPMDKAGSYAVQGLGALFVEAVDGNYTNVVGLPVPEVYRLFAELGHDLRDFRARAAAGAPAPLPTALSQGPPSSLQELAARYLGEYEAKIRLAVARLDDRQLWWRPNAASNSVGNLLLHLAGNLGQWIVAGVGGEPHRRDRAGEFAADRSAGREQMLAGLHAAVERAQAVLRALTPDDLARPLAIQRYDTNVLGAAFHAVEHMSYHTGQILTVAKQLTGGQEAFELYPQHRAE
jgi:nucleoside triphosphate pyrophosphatase